MPSNIERAGAPARNRLLDAGAALLAAVEGEELLRTLTAVTVSKAAGLSRRTFYDQFPTTGDYTVALVGHLSDLDTTDSETSPRASLDDSKGDVRQVVTHLVHSVLERRRMHQPGRAAFIARLLDASSSNAFATPSEWVPLVHSLVQAGVVPLHPFTPADVATTLDRVIDGFSIGDATGDAHIAVNVLLSVLTRMTTARGNELEPSATDKFEHRVTRAWRERVFDQPVKNIHRLVLHAASEEIVTNGFQRLNLAVLSDRTGLSEAMIGKYLGTTRDIADALLGEFYPGLAIALEDELAKSMSAERVLSAHVIRVVTLSRGRPEFAETELAVRTTRVSTHAPLPARQQLDELLEELIRRLRGQNDSQTARQLAGVVQQLSCTVARELPSYSPESCAEMVLATTRAQTS